MKSSSNSEINDLIKLIAKTRETEHKLVASKGHFHS